MGKPEHSQYVTGTVELVWGTEVLLTEQARGNPEGPKRGLIVIKTHSYRAPVLS